MVVAIAQRIEQRQDVRQDVTCLHCGGFLIAITRRFDVPPGTIWVRARCLGRCRKWAAVDVATGKPMAEQHERINHGAL